MSKTSPTQRSLAFLRKQGWTCGVVERWIAQISIRQDFCGGIDLIAFRALTVFHDRGVLGVQCCSGRGALAKHKAKLLDEPRMREWVASGARLVIHSWRRVNDRQPGKRKLWDLDEVELRLEDFEGAALPQELSA